MKLKYLLLLSVPLVGCSAIVEETREYQFNKKVAVSNKVSIGYYLETGNTFPTSAFPVTLNVYGNDGILFPSGTTATRPSYVANNALFRYNTSIGAIEMQYDSLGWSEIWGSINDGIGSGLDADLLDGQHASYFARQSDLSTVSGRVDVVESDKANVDGSNTATNFADNAGLVATNDILQILSGDETDQVPSVAAVNGGLGTKVSQNNGTATNLTVTTTLMIGGKARLVALTNGVSLEVLSGTNWITQTEWTEQ